jgi:phage baseplate assembly protein W
MNGSGIIGQGWGFPIRVNASGGLDWTTGPARIKAAIWIILSTSLGERLMMPDFGAGIKDYVFESNSEVIQAKLQSAVSKALLQWEPRIQVLSVQTSMSPDQVSQVLINISYQIRDTNELFNMVYPFFLQEGTL